MKYKKRMWRAIWVVFAMLVALEVVMFFRSDQPLEAGTKLYFLLLAIVALIEIRILQGEPPVVRKLGWSLGAGLLLLLLAQFIFPETILLLWNFSLAIIVLMSGVVMFAMIGKTTIARAFVVFLTLCLTLLMILEFASPLVHKIALGIFVTGALICIHLITTSRQH